MASADKLGQALGNTGKLQEDQERIKRLKRSQQQDELEGEEAANMVYTDSSTFLKVLHLLVTVHKSCEYCAFISVMQFNFIFS